MSLAPSNFDAKSTLRSREGFKIDETEMAFFRESMLVKEADEQEIMRVKDSNDPYAADVIAQSGYGAAVKAFGNHALCGGAFSIRTAEGTDDTADILSARNACRVQVLNQRARIICTDYSGKTVAAAHQSLRYRAV